MTDVDDLLQKTSRTFAVTIPMLPSPTRHQVGVAYLLFRIIDTFEDATHWPPAQRIEMIETLTALLDAPDQERARHLAEHCLADPPLQHVGYLELLREIPFVLRKYADLPEEPREILRHHVKRSAQGMAQIVGRCDQGGHVSLTTVQELRDYCYIVAGIVGEMLTELFLLQSPSLQSVAGDLRARAVEFGEALQLVNILKDAQSDRAEKRSYLPLDAHLSEVFVLARADLRRATEYTELLRTSGADRGIVAFNALNLRLAIGTLHLLHERGPGAKLTRVQVAGVAAQVMSALSNGGVLFPERP
jgi:farnesyl-diphosphate farnesyltransferase